MRKKRLLILLGILVALIFFYVGLDKWLESKPESVPPPVVVRPTPKQPVQPTSPPQEEKAKEEPKAEEKKETQKQKEDLIAQKIQEEKKKEEETKGVQKTLESKKLTAQKQETRKESEKVEEEKIQKSTVAEQEKQAEKPKGKVKEYVIQIGAFISKENADRALEKAKSMGYRGEIVSEDKFYKVRVRVKTDDPKKVLAKLKATFGGAIIKQ
jgi:type IV secretory pathway VirB10-like protein